MPTNLRELGVNPTDEEYKILAEVCFKATNGGIGSILRLKLEDMEKIYRLAY